MMVIMWAHNLRVCLAKNRSEEPFKSCAKYLLHFFHERGHFFGNILKKLLHPGPEALEELLDLTEHLSKEFNQTFQKPSNIYNILFVIIKILIVFVQALLKLAISFSRLLNRPFGCVALHLLFHTLKLLMDISFHFCKYVINEVVDISKLVERLLNPFFYVL